MYIFCTELLNLDGIVASATAEVEPFYTDLLLFEKVVKKTGQRNFSVKGNPSTCCYLHLGGKKVEETYNRVYGRKSPEFNLFHFFIQTTHKNIQLPTTRQCLQAYTVKQTISHAKILENFPELAKTFTELDRKVIKNLDVSNVLFFDPGEQKNKSVMPRTYRYEIRQKVWCYLSGLDKIIPATLHNLSESGFKMVLHDEDVPIDTEKSVFVFFHSGDKIIQFYGSIVWAASKTKVGCSVDIKNNEWVAFRDQISNDYIKQVS